MSEWTGAIQVAEPVVGLVVNEILKEDTIKLFGDRLFDLLEDVVINSETKIDDITVLPVVKALRAGLNIPDKD